MFNIGTMCLCIVNIMFIVDITDIRDERYVHEWIAYSDGPRW